MMTYKRYALGPSGRPCGRQATRSSALHHNQWSLGIDHLNNIDNSYHERRLTGRGCTERRRARILQTLPSGCDRAGMDARTGAGSDAGQAATLRQAADLV